MNNPSTNLVVDILQHGVIDDYAKDSRAGVV